MDPHVVQQMNYIDIITKESAFNEFKSNIPEEYIQPLLYMLDEAFYYLHTDDDYLDEEYLILMLDSMGEYSINQFERRLNCYTLGINELSGKEGGFINPETEIFLDNDYVTPADAAVFVLMKVIEMAESNGYQLSLIYKLYSISAQINWLHIVLITMLHSEYLEQRNVRKNKVAINEYATKLMEDVWKKHNYISTPIAAQFSLAYAEKMISDAVEFGCEQFKREGLVDILAKHPISALKRYPEGEFYERKEREFNRKFRNSVWVKEENNYSITYLAPTRIFDENLNRLDIKNERVVRKSEAISRHLLRFLESKPEISIVRNSALAIAKLKQYYFVDYDKLTKTVSVEEGHVLCKDENCPCHVKRMKKEEK